MASIAARFSVVDAVEPRKLLDAWKREKFAIGIPQKLEAQTHLARKLARFLALAVRELR